jgi:hypothetical protein
MKKTWANLTVALSQPWVTWVLFGFAVAVYGLLVLKEACSDRFASYRSSEFLALLLPLSMFLLGRHGLEDMASKPFSFLLPGYRESLRKSSFSRAARWGALFSLWLFSFSWGHLLSYWEVRQTWSGSPSGLPPGVSLPLAPSIPEISLSMVGGFLGGTVCYLF